MLPEWHLTVKSRPVYESVVRRRLASTAYHAQPENNIAAKSDIGRRRGQAVLSSGASWSIQPSPAPINDQ